MMSELGLDMGEAAKSGLVDELFEEFDADGNGALCWRGGSAWLFARASVRESSEQRAASRERGQRGRR